MIGKTLFIRWTLNASLFENDNDWVHTITSFIVEIKQSWCNHALSGWGRPWVLMFV